MKDYFEKPFLRGILLGLGFAVGLGTAVLLPVAVDTIHTFSTGTPVSSSKINENFASLKKAVEAVAEVPAGTIVAYGGVNPPAGWLICDGSAISRSTYSALYAVIGIHFGIGNGSSTFHLPDLRHRFLRGWDNLGTSTLDPDKDTRTAINGGNSGTGLGSVQEDEVGSHKHNLNFTNLNISGIGFNGGSASSPLENGPWAPNLEVLASTGKETRPKNVYVNFIIKY